MSQTSTVPGKATPDRATAAAVISVSTTVPLLLGIVLVWFIFRRKWGNSKSADAEDRTCNASQAAETDGSPISELSDWKEAREMEDTGVREMQAPPAELQGDIPVEMAAWKDELGEEKVRTTVH